MRGILIHAYIPEKICSPHPACDGIADDVERSWQRRGLDQQSHTPAAKGSLWNLTCPICSHPRRCSHFPLTALDHADVQAVRHLAGKGHATERSYQWRLSSRHSFKGSRRCISAEKIAEIHCSTAVGRTGITAIFLGNDCKRTVPKFTQSRATPVRFT